MVPDKFNMVDMEGIDIITSQGETVEGLYQKLVESIAQCRYQCLYNWKFDGILIPPTYVEMDIVDDVVWINEGVSVDENDVIYISTLEPPVPVEPVIQQLSVTENGTYTVPVGVDGYNPVSVSVPTPQPVLNSLSVTENGTYTPPTGVDGYNEVVVDVPSGGSNPAFIDYDFTKCSGSLNLVTYNSNGAVFPSSITANAYIRFPCNKNNITIYIDVASMVLASGAHRRFVMIDNSNGLIYRSTGVWSIYNGTWHDSQNTDGSFFDNSKVKVYIDTNGYWHIYKNNVLAFEINAVCSLTTGDLRIGSGTGNSIVNSILTGCRIYDGDYTET